MPSWLGRGVGISCPRFRGLTKRSEAYTISYLFGRVALWGVWSRSAALLIGPLWRLVYQAFQGLLFIRNQALATAQYA